MALDYLLAEQGDIFAIANKYYVLYLDTLLWRRDAVTQHKRRSHVATINLSRSHMLIGFAQLIVIRPTLMIKIRQIGVVMSCIIGLLTLYFSF